MKNRLFCILLIVMMFFIVGCTKENVDGEKVIVENKELTDEQINDLMNRVNDLKYMDYYNKYIVPRNLTNQEALRISYEILVGEGKAQSGKLKFADLERVALSYLGFSLEPENLICDTHYNIQDGGGADIMIYNVDSGIYYTNTKHLGHTGGGLRTEVYNSYFDGNESNGVYTIIVKKIFSELLGDAVYSKLNYYASYDDSAYKRNVLFVSDDVQEDDFDKYSDKLINYTYKFVLKDGNYVLTEYKIG